MERVVTRPTWAAFGSPAQSRIFTAEAITFSSDRQLPIANAPLPILSKVSNDLGVFAAAALNHPGKTCDKHTDVRLNLLTVTDGLSAWSEVTGNGLCMSR